MQEKKIIRVFNKKMTVIIIIEYRGKKHEFIVKEVYFVVVGGGGDLVLAYSIYASCVSLRRTLAAHKGAPTSKAFLCRQIARAMIDTPAMTPMTMNKLERCGLMIAKLFNCVYNLLYQSRLAGSHNQVHK